MNSDSPNSSNVEKICFATKTDHHLHLLLLHNMPPMEGIEQVAFAQTFLTRFVSKHLSPKKAVTVRIFYDGELETELEFLPEDMI